MICPIKIHFIKYNCITTTSQTPIINITKNHEYNAYGAYMSIHSYVAQPSTIGWHMNKCSYVQTYISTFVYLGGLLNDNTNDNEWMIMGILLHWYYLIDWLTLVRCICEHMFTWTNETPYSVSKIFNIQKGEPFSTGGGIIITNPRPYKRQSMRTIPQYKQWLHTKHTIQWSTNPCFIYGFIHTNT